MKKSVYVLYIAMGVVFLASIVTAQSVSLRKNTFAPGEKIVVTFKAPSGYPGHAWIGIIPSDVDHGSEEVNDNNDIASQYMRKRTSGTMTFYAPRERGSYDIRMNDNDDNGKEVASVTFVVGNDPALLENLPSLRIPQTAYAPNTEIVVTFTAPKGYNGSAWVGIVPSTIKHGSEVVNHNNMVDRQFLYEKTEGTLVFRAPLKPGAWDFRMNDNDTNGKEVASVSFTVK